MPDFVLPLGPTFVEHGHENGCGTFFLKYQTHERSVVNQVCKETENGYFSFGLIFDKGAFS